MGKMGEAIMTTKKYTDPGGYRLLKKIKGDDDPAPVAAATPEMPDPDGDAVAAAKRRRLAAMQVRGGRESTFLAGETLGG